MSWRTKILGTACAAVVSALALGPAWADFSGTLDGDYAHIDLSHGGGSGNEWGGDASARVGFGAWGLNAQVDGGYHQVTANSSSGHFDDWDVNGSLFWLGNMGRLGAAVGYNGLNFSGGGGNGHLTNYGGFAEWYAAPMFTLGVKGGGASANNGGGTADYVGGEAIWYIFPDFDVNGTVDYISISSSHLTNYSANAEWLVSESLPISVFGGYTRTEVSSSRANTLMIGLKFYTNSNGASTLADRQRSGNVDWASHVNVIGLLF